MGPRSAQEFEVGFRIIADGCDPGTGLRGDVENVRFVVEAAALPERTSGAARVVPSAFGAARLDLGRRREQWAQAILRGYPDGFRPTFRREAVRAVLEIAL